MSEHKTYIAELILPLAVKGTFQYIIPEDDVAHAKSGMRCIVQFGKKKIYTALIFQIIETSSPHPKLKHILEIIDNEPIVNQIQLSFFQWISEYYMCYLGEVMRASLPSGLKLNSESRIELLEKNWEDKSDDLDEDEIAILKLLDTNENLSIDQVASAINKLNPQKILQKLSDNEFIAFYEHVVDRYRPKKVKKIRMMDEYNSSRILEKLFEQFEKKEKQIEVLMIYLKETNVLDKPGNNINGLENSVLIANGASQSSINTLIKYGILEAYEERISRFPRMDDNERIFELSPAQEKAKKEILNSWKKSDIVLLKGMTGSGKTEIYIKLIQEELKKGKQCLYLLPEIALTTHIVQRLQKVFGNKIGVYHSRFSDNERVEIWENVLNKKYDLIIGVRSSLFLPFENLGLVIIDEEHDGSYKQNDPAPRYHARESSIILSSKHKAKVLLGSATPSLESYYLCEIGKWQLVELNERFHKEAELPKLEIHNFRLDKVKGLTRGIFTIRTIDAINKTLKEGKQIIIFQNRRGYSPYQQCQTCGYIPMCHQCDVSLTLHQYLHQLRCHYCGYYEEPPKNCPRCNDTKFQTMGTGTEMVEEEIGLQFPEAKVQRMDLDTTRGKYAHQRILEAFEQKETNILVGTQMVSKGLDFDNVELVIILGTDRMMFFPDYRAIEKSYQMITQVSGRAGRKSNTGRVIIQSNLPEHELFELLKNNDYKAFYNKQIEDRQNFFYPPFTRTIRLILKSKLEFELESESKFLTVLLRQSFGKNRVLGSEKPPVGKVRNLHIREIFLKFERDEINPKLFKEKLKSTLDKFHKSTQLKSIRIIIDVDPS